MNHVNNRTKQDLIEILKAIQPYGFRESLVCDDELEHLLTDIAEDYGISAEDYAVEED